MFDHSVFARHLDLTPLGGRARGKVLCPFHQDRTPSLSVDLSAGIFHCFGCGAEGGVREFKELLLRRGFADALVIAERQKWARDPQRTINEVQDRIREARREIDAIRASAEDTPAGWAQLARAADLERLVMAAEMEIDG